MSIDYAILGILSYKSMTGYDLKKIIQGSAFMHWSGNNNQIYKALVELLDKGLVTNVVKHQENSPSKKIYTITNEGLASLKDWVLSPSEPSEIRKPFLVHLAWTKQLNTSELNTLIDEYEKQVKMQLLMHESNKPDMIFSPDRTALETTIWSLINDNIRRTYENELLWIQDIRNAILNLPNENDLIKHTDVKEMELKEKNNEIMKYNLINNNEISYIYFNSLQAQLNSERNILDIITACAENDTQFVLFDVETLSKDFFKSKNGLTGTLLQKFSMYHIKSAVIIKDIKSIKGELKTLLTESGKHNVLRAFSNISDAEKWFLSLKQKGETFQL